jgi:[ribosomal protein S5]-alanine N-acetyltransferase
MKYLLDQEETERLYFRKILWTDFDEWLPFHQDPTCFQFWNEPREEAEAECRKWYEKQFDRYTNELGGMNALIEKNSGNLIGHCGLLIQHIDDHKELEIAYSLLPRYWNNGYALEAARKCKDFAFENHFSESLISIISTTNKPSEKVAEKNGMSKDGKTVYKKNEVKILRCN